MADARAVLFDLDDTLYPLEHFRMSGFRAVAAAVAARGLAPAADALAILRVAASTAPGRELQALAGRLGLDGNDVPRLLEIIRTHVPDLRLPTCSAAVLQSLRPGWRLGIVTNGRPDIQARKVRALGLDALVDTVVFATACGTGVGKPDAAPFQAACRRLGVTPAQAVFVGDDPDCDIAGAHGAGMQTIWLPSRTPGRAAELAGAIVASLADVPAAAHRLMTPEWRAHVA